MKKRKTKNATKKKTVVFIIGILLIIIDQVIKFLVINKKTITLIPGFMDISYSQNNKVMFGLFNIDLATAMVITFVILGFITKLMIYYFNKGRFMHSASLMLILSGGFSNLIDRILRGYVIDYIEITLFDFPSINLADFIMILGVVIFVILLLVDLIYPERKRERRRRKKLMKKEEKKKQKAAKKEIKMDKKIEEVLEEKK